MRCRSVSASDAGSGCDAVGADEVARHLVLNAVDARVRHGRAQEGQQLVGELPVALGPERFAGGGDAVAAAGAARAAAFIPVGDQAFALERRQVLPDGSDSNAEAAGDLLGGGFARLLDRREDAAP